MNKYIIALLTACTTFAFVLIILKRIFRDKLIIINRVQKLVSNDKPELQVQKIKKKKNERKLDTKIKFLKRLANELSVSGISMRPSEFLFMWALVTLIPSSLCLVFSFDFIVALGALLLGLFTPPLIMFFKKGKRIELFEKQLVEATAVICNCLRSGLTFLQALESIANEMPEPISKEFSRVLREMKLGNSLEKALNNMSARINSKDFTLIVSAVLIQRQIGGNLSEVLSSLASTIKERDEIKKEIKVLTTTGRTSGIVVGAIPIFILLFFMMINPSYVRLFFESSLGIGMLVAAGVLEGIGFLIINKIVNIKF
ncbi:MAG: type II secretion system F family protein [Bacillota bacterium]|nr:type II secretion system F family protein [Bacillota bacterium]